MLELLRGRWGLFVARGGVGVAYALLALFWPETESLWPAAVLAGYLVADGVLGLLLALRGKEASSLERLALALPALFVLAGVAVTAAGYALEPLLALVVLVVTSVGWPVLNGAGLVVLAIRVRELYCRVGFALLGTMSIVVGVLVLNLPVEGMSLWTLLAYYALLSGVVFGGLGWRARRG
ncbi:uncharacterized membrane protein HdeD (DUF308 family) [Crossiella equi]|uniref:Uncharacterized membrane protein HdeD (DUF308 family) n=1 Tax=Crossiella equi TaxID=130796 RepID=A0ABS5A9T9_9PSEU|nr:DUF308 domain-containing protein [Crossiella equi]MBP2473354.1 uncharacterized membrane protein HdeD (DUF308 family) [Crossiella equi]